MNHPNARFENRIYRLTVIDDMKMFLNDSFDLVVTSPPYDHLRASSGFTGHDAMFQKLPDVLNRLCGAVATDTDPA
jgi:DNA modification methylase